MNGSVDPQNPRQSTPWRLPLWLAFCMFLAIALFFLWEEHRAHILGVIPYAVLLLCPLIHLFMHRGHSGHHHSPGGRENGDYHNPRGGLS
jgi:hypothetical protein